MAEEITISSEQQQTEDVYIGANAPKYLETNDYNPLHDYRSYNYVWTLAVLSRSEFNEPDKFARSNYDLQYVILKSSGKGKGTQTADATLANLNGETEFDARPEITELVNEFNNSGYGRFDFYIDNVEINSNWSITNGSQPTSVRFEVIEPFSINGFIESLRVNALAAGYEHHVGVPYVLKLEFIGYKKTKNPNDPLPAPEVIPNSTRFFPININQILLETTERGTVYKCAGNAYNSTGLGSDGQLATSVKMKGHTVYDVLDNLMKQVEEARKQDTGSEETKHFNEYKIVFLDEEGNEKGKESNIGKSYMNEALRSNQVYSFPHPKDRTDKNATKTAEDLSKIDYDPTAETVSFAAGSSITDIITAVVRDSTYTKQLLEEIEAAKDSADGLVNWFRVTVSIEEIKPETNPKTGSLNYIYTFKVRPYKVHYSLLPGFASGIFDGEDLKGVIRRTYDYYYTGKNVDILNFKLKFNHLWIQSRAYKMGNKDMNGTAVAAGASNTDNLKESESPHSKERDEPGTPKKIDPSLTTLSPEGGTAIAAQSSPYMQLGLAIHKTLLDTNNLNVIDLDIIGDPFYLVTSDIGNQEEKQNPSKPGETVNGQATYLGGAVFFELNFRNPKDIKKDGWADFGEGLLPFSGIFQINTVAHSFREGKFEQRFRAIRLPGQKVTAKSTKSVATPEKFTREGTKSTKDTAPSSVSRLGARASDATLLNLISRGLPTVGLPGLLSNFSNAVGGALGGVNTSLQTTLQRVDASVSNALAPINGALQQAQSVLNIAAQVGGLVAAGQALINGFDNPGGAPGLGNPVGGYNPYSSGIRVNANGLNDVLTGSAGSEQASVVSQSRIVSSFVQDSSNLRTLNQNYFNNVISNRIPVPENKVSNVGSRSTEVTNSTAVDPKALAYKLGIDPAQLSGLSGEQQSNVLSQLVSLANKIPENTDIAGLKALGISLKNVYGASIPNLPALQPLTTAPLANVPALDLQKILASGGNVSNLPGALTIPGIAAFLAILNKDKGVPSPGLAAGTGQFTVQSTIDKLDTLNTMNINLESNSNFSPAQIGLGSVEANLANTNARVQGFGGYYVISKTTYAQYGTQRKDSPIDKLMQTKV